MVVPSTRSSEVATGEALILAVRLSMDVARAREVLGVARLLGGIRKAALAGPLLLDKNVVIVVVIGFRYGPLLRRFEVAEASGGAIGIAVAVLAHVGAVDSGRRDPLHEVAGGVRLPEVRGIGGVLAQVGAVVPLEFQVDALPDLGDLVVGGGEGFRPVGPRLRATDAAVGAVGA